MLRLSIYPREAGLVVHLQPSDCDCVGSAARAANDAAARRGAANVGSSFTQVMNNVERAEAYLKRADEVEEATTTTATAADGSGRLTLMGRSEPCDGSKEAVRAQR